MSFRDTQNPGIGGLDELTDAETSFIQNLAGLSYAQGDILYHNGTNLVRLAAGTNGQFLKTQGAGANPVWATVSGAGDVVGPSSATDNAIVRFDSTTGKLIQNSGVTISDNNDLTAYDATNDGNPEFRLGAADAEELHVQTVYDTGAQTLSHVLFTTDVASATADKGLYRFNVDGTDILDIDDGGINFAASKGISIAGTDIITDSAGTATLSNIDALDATTEATIEAAIDTLANLTSIQGRTVTLADAGTNAFFGWDDTAGAYENLTAAEAEAIIEPLIDTLANLTSVQGLTITLADAGADALFGWDDSAAAYQNLSAADARTALGLATTDSPQFTAINLGHASDTTLARVSAGVVSIEGVNIVTESATQTLTNKTLTSPTLTTPSAFTTGGTITLAENTSIALDPAGSADGKWTGITITGTSGYAQAFGDLVYLDPTDSRWEAADANAASGADGDARGILGMVVSAGTDGNACTILLVGVIRADAKFPAFTINNPIYVSETAGSVTQTQPTTTDVVIRIVGAALTADEMYFNPDFTWTTHT